MSIKWNPHKIREAGSSGVRRNLREASPGRPGQMGGGVPSPPALLFLAQWRQEEKKSWMGHSWGLTPSLLFLPGPISPEPPFWTLPPSCVPALVFNLCAWLGNLFWLWRQQRWDSILLVSLGGALLLKPSHSGEEGGRAPSARRGRDHQGGSLIRAFLFNCSHFALPVFAGFFFFLFPDLPSLHFLANILLHTLSKFTDSFFYWITASCSF